MKSKSVNHRRITPLCQDAKEETERFMRPLFILKVILKDCEEEMIKFVIAYRVTP